MASIALVIGLLGAGTAAAVEPIEPEAVPVAKARTVITAEGMAGARLEIPQDTQLPYQGIDLKVEDGTYAFVGFFYNPCTPSPGNSVCLRARMDWWDEVHGPEFNASLLVSLPDPPWMDLAHDVYVVTDGRVTLTLDFEGPNLAPGTLHLPVTGAITASFDKLPVTCDPLPSCDNAGWGGMARDVGERGFASAIAYTYRPAYLIRNDLAQIPNYAGSMAAQACIYPNRFVPGASTDPDRYPYGCDYDPTDSDNPTYEADNLWWLVQPSVQPWFTGMIHRPATTIGPSGPVYIGFTNQVFSPLVDGYRHGALGMWLELDIDCPSRDWAGC